MTAHHLRITGSLVAVAVLFMGLSAAVLSGDMDDTSAAPPAGRPGKLSEADDAEGVRSADANSDLLQDKTARGKYLVHHVAQCIQCHTPRDKEGALLRSKLLTGAPIPIAGPRFARPWAAESAWIAGLGSYDENFVHYLLTHGRRPDGSRPKPPMPSFQMTDADAAAVIAYLRSL